MEYSSTDISGNEVGMVENLKAAGFSDARQISGIGDGAVWGTNSLMGRPQGELSVRKGKTILLMIIMAGQDAATALDHAKALTQKILPKA